MNIHEYQAKELLRTYGVPVPDGGLASTPKGALAIAKTLPGPVWVVKAQVHAGGRGKSGGVRICSSLDEVELAAEKILGMRIVTDQTSAGGKKIQMVLVEQGADFDRELYLAVALNTGLECLTVMASPDGGMDIEKVAQDHPERIFSACLDKDHRLWPFQTRNILLGCGLDAKQAAAGVDIVAGLVRLCVEKDASQAEINPLVIDKQGKPLALDAKLNFDESALKRHPEIAALEDPHETDPLELKAAALGVNYVRLDGYIGTMVNGAGLAMATMDAIKQNGGEPANFLDTGGGANVEMIRRGFEIMLLDPNVRGILINIFGGILRCDIVAEGVVRAVKETGLSLPLVMRMEGTNVDEGRKILAESGLMLNNAASIAEAAAMIVEKTKRVGP